MNLIENIASQFPIGPIEAINEINSGLMHSTFHISSQSGEYTLQRLHAKLSTPEIIKDFEAVTQYLAVKSHVAPRLVKTKAQALVHTDSHGRWWRMATWIAGETRKRVQSAVEALEGARALGRFHRVVADFEHRFASQHPLHDTVAHLNGLKAAVEAHQHQPYFKQIERSVYEILTSLPDLILPDSLPQRVVHGDPKISNVLFRGDEAVGLIDLDTCNRHTVLVDLGDAVRSWCRDGSEDEQQHFRIDRFEAILAGYSEDGLSLSRHEIDYLGQAGRTITMELASRFAKDVMVDEYFAYDTVRYESRRAHNIARTRAMIFLAHDMKRQEADVRRLVSHYFPGT